jgi:hypothetical protein
MGCALDGNLDILRYGGDFLVGSGKSGSYSVDILAKSAVKRQWLATGAPGHRNSGSKSMSHDMPKGQLRTSLVRLDAKLAFRNEMACARSAESNEDLLRAKKHLERAHILGQRWLFAHMEAHFQMLRLAHKSSDTKEVRGQLIRLIGLTPFHIIGWVPVGNTGGANVSATRPMPIPTEFQPYFEGHSLRRGFALRGFLLVVIVTTYMFVFR